MKSVLFPFSLFFLFSIGACTKHTGYTYENFPQLSLPRDSTGISIVLNVFPLNIGNTWTYETQYQNGWNYHTAVPITTDTFSITVVTDTIVNGFRIYKLIAMAHGAPYTPAFLDILYWNSSSAYVYQDATGFYQLPSIAHIDSNYVYDSTQYVVRFPAIIDSSWLCTIPNDGGTPVTEAWDSYNFVSTPAGNFNCIKDSMYDYALTSAKYYSSKGLIQAIHELSFSGGPGYGPITDITVVRLIGVNF